MSLHIANAVDKTVMMEFAMMSSSRRSGKVSEAMSIGACPLFRNRMVFGYPKRYQNGQQIFEKDVGNNEKCEASVKFKYEQASRYEENVEDVKEEIR